MPEPSKGWMSSAKPKFLACLAIYRAPTRVVQSNGCAFPRLARIFGRKVCFAILYTSALKGKEHSPNKVLASTPYKTGP
eukprot:3631989-Amphidinium_carterae.1